VVLSCIRLKNADPELRTRLAEWLAYHLSNFEYVWPWPKWGHVLTAPPHHPQRCASPSC
jgi:nuclear cap-binding protein subunit 1